MAFLNAGDMVIAELPASAPGFGCFVSVRPTPKPDIPRQERRYLNSTWSIWEYWDFAFRRITLRPGWEEDKWNYDLYLISNDRRMTHDDESFAKLVAEWCCDTADFKHVTESESPE